MSENFLLPVLPFNSKYSNKKIKLESLMEYPLLLREKGGSIGRNLIDSIFEMHNIKNTICMESESTQAIINAVHSGIGISFLPNGMIKKHLQNNYVSTCEITNVKFKRNNYVVWHKHKFLTKTMKYAVDLFKKEHNIK